MILKETAFALPNSEYSNQNLAKFCAIDDEFMEQKVGITHRRWLAASESEIDLAETAVGNLHKKAHLDWKNVDLLIWVGQVKTQLIPSAASILQGRLGLPHSCICFDLGLACSGYIYALVLAQALFDARQCRNALIITCDPYSKILDLSDRNTTPLFGDAATATWLDVEGSGLELGQSDLGSDGSRARYLACAAPDYKLFMDGKEIFNFVLKEMPGSINRCLDLNGVSAQDIDYYIFHQANEFILRYLCKYMRLPEAKCPIYLRHTANTVSSSIPLMLSELMKKFKKNDRIILSSFGGGLSWGTIYGQYR